MAASGLLSSFFSFSSRETRICPGKIPRIPPPSIDRIRVKCLFAMILLFCGELIAGLDYKGNNNFLFHSVEHPEFIFPVSEEN
jgi:hypothetical protein